jgi:hypothetical protein
VDEYVAAPWSLQPSISLTPLRNKRTPSSPTAVKTTSGDGRFYLPSPFNREEIRGHRRTWRTTAPVEIDRWIGACQHWRAGEWIRQWVGRVTGVVIVFSAQAGAWAADGRKRCREGSVPRRHSRCGGRCLAGQDTRVARPADKLLPRRRDRIHVDKSVSRIDASAGAAGYCQSVGRNSPRSYSGYFAMNLVFRKMAR